tara:strand:- start:1096 stop:2634 length:1539 start_codon:yes stop_codon:yes gene_type:complete
MPDLSNIPGFTELAGISDLPSFPTQADSWNAPDDASSKTTSYPTFTVSGVNVELNDGSATNNARHVMRGQGGIKGNNKIITTTYLRSSGTYSSFSSAYQYGFQTHVWTINTSTGALTCSTTNTQNITGSNSQTGYQSAYSRWYDAPGSGYLMGTVEMPISPNTNGRSKATIMRQIDSSFSNIDLALSYDAVTSGGGIHEHSNGVTYPNFASLCVPLTSTDSSGGASFMRYGADQTSLERAYPNGAEVSYDTNTGVWRSGYARYAGGYGTYIQPDAPLCGANDFHSIIGGYSSTNNNYRCVQSSGDGSYFETPETTNYYDSMAHGASALGYQRSGSTHTIYLRASQGNRSGQIIPMTAYNTDSTDPTTATAKSWTFPNYGKREIGHSCVGIGSNRWISSFKENSDFFQYYNGQMDGWPLIQWEIDDTNGAKITGAVNIPKLDFGKGYPVRISNIDANEAEAQWAFPIWTNANDAEPSWLVVVFFRPGSNYAEGTQPIVKSYPWPTFKSLNISL